MSAGIKANADGVSASIQVNEEDRILLNSDGSVSTPDAGNLFGTENILGTVSQSSGVPTGAIIESGSNVNGRYVRYADGTQICYVSKNIDASVTAGSAVSSLTTHAAVFSGTPVVHAVAVFYSGTGSTGTRYYGITFASSTGVMAIMNTGVSPSASNPSFTVGTGNAASYTLEQISIGRWY